MIKSEGVQVGVGWRTIGTIKLEYKTNLHRYDIVKAVLFQLVTSIEVESTSHGGFQRQCFQFTLIPQWAYFLLVRKIRPFLHENVFIAQSDAYRWFYGPIFAKWLPLSIENFAKKRSIIVHIPQRRVLQFFQKTFRSPEHHRTKYLMAQ